MTKRVAVLLFGVGIYCVFLITVGYGVGFVGNLNVWKSIDSGSPGPFSLAIAVDLLLIAVFGLQHSVMARPSFKARWLNVIPPSLERSVYVLCASLSLLLLFWQWQPLPRDLWHPAPGPVHSLLLALFWFGWLDVVYSTFLVNHFDLFGLRHVFLYFRDIEYTPVPFKQSLLYRYVRHPLMLAFLVAFWATPRMTVGHFVFAMGMTVVIVIGTILEERDLLSLHGSAYARYRKSVSMFIPVPRRK
jgi:protein-S-isoprenylcysteine O-methyltransferase Ste14